MINRISRRAAIQGGAALAGFAALGFPSWPAAQLGAEEVIPWTDVPQGFDPSGGAGPHSLDTRTHSEVLVHYACGRIFRRAALRAYAGRSGHLQAARERAGQQGDGVDSRRA